MRSVVVRTTGLVGALALVTSLAGVGGVTANAASAPAGVGTTQVTTKMLDLSVGGGLLDVSLLTDSGSSNTDPKVGQSSANNKLAPLSITSTSIDAVKQLNDALSTLTTPMEAQTPGATPSVDKAAIDFSTLSALKGLISGTLAATKLSTVVDATNGAVSKLTASLTNLDLLGGLVSVDTMQNQDALQSATAAASGTRTLNVGNISLLKLGTLLGLLGIKPAALPVSLVTGLVDKLGLPVAALKALSTPLSDATNTIRQALDKWTAATQGQPASATVTVESALTAPIDNLIKASLPTGPGTQVSVLVGDLTKVLTDLPKFLVTLLTQGLSSLLDTPLVQVNTGALSVITKAVSAVPDSVADVTGQQPTLKVAGQVVPGLDLTSLLSTLQSTLSGLLKSISPNLAGLVSLTLLNPSHSVTSANGYTDALSRVSELALTIDPTKITGGVTQTMATLATGGTSIGSLLDLSKLTSPLAPLTSLLGSGVDLLAKPTTLSLAQVTSESKFAVIPAVTPPAALPAKPAAVLPAQLPRTGENSTPFIAGAAVLILLSLGAWRLRRRVSEN